MERESNARAHVAAPDYRAAMRRRRRVVAILLSVAGLAVLLPGCGGKSGDIRRSASTTMQAPVAATVEIDVTVAADPAIDAPTQIVLGGNAISLDGGVGAQSATATKTSDATGLITATAADGRVQLAAVVPSAAAVLGPVRKVVIDERTTAAAVAFGGIGLATGDPVVDAVVLMCLLADPQLDEAAREVHRLVVAGIDPLAGADVPLVAALNAVVSNIAGGRCGPEAPIPAPATTAGLRAPVAAVETDKSCIKGKIVDPDGYGPNAVCVSFASDKAAAGRTNTVVVKNPTPRWVAIEDPLADNRIVGFIEPKRWAIPGITDLVKTMATEYVKESAKWLCEKVTFGLLCEGGGDFGKAWKKVKDMVVNSLADAETEFDMPASAWGKPLLAVSFGGGPNGSDIDGVIGASDAGPPVTFALTFITDLVLPAIGLLKDMDLKKPRKNVRKNLSNAFAESLAEMLGGPDAADTARGRGEDPVADALIDLATNLATPLNEYLRSLSLAADRDLDGLEAVGATYGLLQTFVTGLIDVVATVDWAAAITALGLDSVLDPAGMVADLAEATIKKLIPGIGWIELLENSIDVINLVGSAGELLIEMNRRASADLFWIGERSVELPKPAGVTDAEMRALDVATTCARYDLGEVSRAEIFDVSIGDIDGDGVADGAAAAVCEFTGTLVPFDVLVVRAADRTPMIVDFGSGVESSWGFVAVGVTAGDGLEVRFMASAESDPHCCPSRDATEQLVWKDGALVQESVEVIDVESTISDMVEAANTGDRATVSKLATPEVADQILALHDTYGALRGGADACTSIDDATVSCLVQTEAGWAASITWAHEDWNRFRATAFEDVGGGA